MFGIQMRKKIIELKNTLFGRRKEENEPEEFIEIPPRKEEKTAKILLKYFVMTDFADVKPIVDSLREGYTIALVKIKPLRDKDITELKRAIEKIKKTVSAIGGDVVGIEEDYIIATPGFVGVYRGESEM
ncbi:hypothetical protein DRN62_00750 [Nanoarchaeota archaeon]|nr:MAG: hypothetical protein DRN62_00750 [Nanoarchaeota archaeon]